MPRAELFLLLACAFALAIMSGPLLPTRSSPMTIATLFPSVEIGGPRADSGMVQHSFDGQ